MAVPDRGASAIGAGGQFFYKRGSQQLSSVPIWKNYDIAIGAALFCAVMVFFVVAYKLGGKMSVVYPFYATTFIWSTFIAVKYLGERVSTLQWIGILTVVVGTALVALGQASTNP
ncbi:MAG: hypothetical protein EOP84_34090 [Verrucomicrobiaceae bacterium]|nr:MAG: hypothetical protein EOP84_34090 [Verrucomicrobiaceae bacterium]